MFFLGEFTSFCLICFNQKPTKRFFRPPFIDPFILQPQRNVTRGGKAHALAFGDDLHHPFMVIYDDFGDGLLILGMLKIQFVLGFTTGNYPIVLGIWRLQKLLWGQRVQHTPDNKWLLKLMSPPSTGWLQIIYIYICIYI